MSRIQIIGIQRTGTTWLTRFAEINMKNYINFGEFLLNRYIGTNGGQGDFFIENRNIAFKETKKNNNYQNVIRLLNLYPDFIIKTQINQLMVLPEKDFIDFNNLMDRRIKIIRKDLIESTISYAYSVSTRNWDSSHKEKEKILIDINSFKEQFYIRKKEYEVLEQFETDVTVYYEDMFKDPLKTWNSLGIEKKEKIILTKGVKNLPKENYVENYEQLVEIGKKIINE